MKDGLVHENDTLVFYKHGKPYHAGAVRIDGEVYYIGKGGLAVKGSHIIHREMTNGILERGTYTFGEDYKLIEGSYVPPRRHKSAGHKKRTSKHKKLRKSVKTAVVCVAVPVIFLLSVALIEMLTDRETVTPTVTPTSADGIVLPTFDEEVLLCSEGAKKLYDHELTPEQAVLTGEPYRPFVFEYSLKSASGELILSEHADYSKPKTYALAADQTSVSIDNLKTATTYYYRVTVGDDVFEGTFTTARSTRFIKLSGIENVRDVGGYTTLDGKTVKQGMIIRGTELDGLVYASYFLDDASIDYVAEEFGFVYDFDLREKSVFAGSYSSRLGSEVRHQFYEAPAYGSIFSAEYYSVVKEIFSDLAKPQNYPMYLHCTFGADRTGTIVFLLQGLLNMSETDMLNDFRITGYEHDTFEYSDHIYVVLSGLQNYEGNTLCEKVESYLLSIGVTEGEIQSIRRILLED